MLTTFSPANDSVRTCENAGIGLTISAASGNDTFIFQSVSNCTNSFTYIPPSASPTPTVTRSATPSTTPTISVTPSVTPSVTATVTPTISVTPTDGAARAWLHQNATVKSSRFDDHGHEQVLVSIDPADHARLCSRWQDLCVLRG